MPNNNNNKTQPSDATTHLVSAFMPIIIGHPLKVGLNLAAYQRDLFPLLNTLRTSWHASLFLNWTRGTSAVFSQSLCKQIAETYFSQNTTRSKVAGWGAAAIAGTIVATFIETIFIRKTACNIDITQFLKLPKTFVSPTLLCYYLVREAGFSFFVLSKNEISPELYYPALFATAYLTATSHKLATWEATADIIQATSKNTTPNATRDGILPTLRAIAYGNVYTHPAFQTPIKSPRTSSQLFYNFFVVSCGFNMLLIRTLHLMLFDTVRSLTIEAMPKVKNYYFSLWRNNQDTVETSRAIQEPTKRNIK